uniref:CSON009400 protein n=1 Tax=Culicoides sonorensis TaxID=179676 RepID=A0A336M088_CULSO
MSIKSEYDEKEFCIACLKITPDLIKEVQISSDIQNIYMKLISEEIQGNDLPVLSFCASCICALEDVYNFKNTCVTSISTLNKKETSNEETKDFESTDYSTNFKFESSEIIFVQEFSVQTEVSGKNEKEIKLPKKEETKLECFDCFQTFSSRKDFNYHRKSEKKKSSDQFLYCDICGYSAKKKGSIYSHMLHKHLPKDVAKRKQDEQNITCPECGKICSSLSKYKTHHRIYHAEKTHTCNECGVSYAFGTDLKRHIERKHEVHYKDCPICGKTYKKISLNGHINSVHLQRRNFACDQCDKTFKSSSQLTKHKYTHGKLRPFMCQECDTGYYMNELLRKHYEREHQIIYSQEEIRKLCGKGPGIGGAPLKYTGVKSNKIEATSKIELI